MIYIGHVYTMELRGTDDRALASRPKGCWLEIRPMSKTLYALFSTGSFVCFDAFSGCFMSESIIFQ